MKAIGTPVLVPARGKVARNLNPNAAPETANLPAGPSSVTATSSPRDKDARPEATGDDEEESEGDTSDESPAKSLVKTKRINNTQHLLFTCLVFL